MPLISPLCLSFDNAAIVNAEPGREDFASCLARAFSNSRSAFLNLDSDLSLSPDKSVSCF